MFIDIYSQWADSDGDGLGDNISEGASLADVCKDPETGNDKSCLLYTSPSPRDRG